MKDFNDRYKTKARGTQFEHEFCSLLATRGFWVHNIVQSASGQPADVIAVRHGTAYLIDCKVSTHDYFLLSRIESNQRLSMMKWNLCGNDWAGFAISMNNEIYMLDYKTALNQTHYRQRLTLKDLRELAQTFKEWVKECD